MSERSRESFILDQHPGLRERVVTLLEFVTWRDTLPMVEVDEELFYVIGGDQLKDQDQIIVAWINQYRRNLWEEYK